MVAHAFSALSGIYFINQLAHVNGRVRAFGLTHITVDAFVRDHQCHGCLTSGIGMRLHV